MVFTLPAEIAQIAYIWNKKAVHGPLFNASAEPLMTIALTPKGWVRKWA